MSVFGRRNDIRRALPILIGMIIAGVTIGHSRSRADLIPLLDSRTAQNAAGQLSVDALRLSSRGRAGVEELEQAIERFREGKFADALQLLRAAEASNGRLPPAQVMLARMFLATGRLAEGQQMLEQAAIDHPGTADLHLTFGDLALSHGRLSDAAVHYEKAQSILATMPPFANYKPVDAFKGLATVAERRGNWMAAYKALLESLRVDPADANARHRIGVAIFHLDRPDKAAEALRQAAQADTSLEPAPLTMAWLYHRKGDAEASGKWIDEALREHGDDARVQRAAAMRLIELHQADKAQAHADRWLALQPESVDAVRLRARVARHSGDHQTAQRLLEKVLQDHPADFAASNQLALVLAASDDADQRRRALQRAEMNARQFPQSAEAIATLGWVRFRNGQREQAAEMLGAAVAAGGADAETIYHFAQVLRDGGAAERAEQVLTSLLQSNQAFPQRREVEQDVPQPAEQPRAADQPTEDASP